MFGEEQSTVWNLKMTKWNKSWFNSLQSGRFFCLIAMLVFGSFSITTTCLLIRSDKKTEIEDALTICGDYDVIVYETPLGCEDYLSNSNMIDSIGLYYELGSVTNNDETGFFKAVALKDSVSEDIYHLTCIRGSYPKDENEIAIDVSVAKVFGIAPYPGETISFKTFDSAGKYIGYKDYIVSGIFRLSDNDSVGGWGRAPLIYNDPDWYPMPAVFFSASVVDSWNCTSETIFIRSSSEGESRLVSEIRRIISESGQYSNGIEYNERRSSGYSWYIGLNQNNFFGASREMMTDAVNGGLFKRDFYSAFVFPIISVLVIICEVFALFMLSKNIIADRKMYYGILRSLGMSSRRVVRGLITEILGLGVIGSIIGIGMGYVAHIVLIRELNNRLHLRLYDGIHVDQIIKQITYDPLIMSLLVCVCSILLALVIPLYKLLKMYPSELLSISESMFVGKTKGKKQKTISLERKWFSFLNKRIVLHDGSTMLIMMIILSSALFGYVFFKAYSEQATIESRGHMEKIGIGENGYLASRSSDLVDWAYVVSNRHDAGVKPYFPELIENNPNVEKSWSVIFNHSTRMVFKEEPDKKIQALLGNRSMNYRPSDNPYSQEIYYAEPTIFKYMGYDSQVYMYELPTVGVTMNEMRNLDEKVIAGEIDIEKIKRGEEIVLAIPEELSSLCLQYFPVGSSLDFDDIVLNDEEEKLDFRTLVDEKWVIYENDIETYAGTEHIGFASFGKRYGIQTTVGAIVVLKDENEISEYLTAGAGWIQQVYEDASEHEAGSKPTYGMSVLCLADSFEKWGLPDKNYTTVKAKLKDDCNFYDFDEFWYKALTDSTGIETESTFEYMDDISVGTNRVMVVFLVLLTILVLLGMMGIITGLFTLTRNNSSRFQTLRRIGLSIKQASILIFLQNMFYPLIASLMAIVPISIMQGVLDSYEARLRAGKLDIVTTPWRFRIPYYADLFSYSFIPALICCMLLGYLLIILATLPQILYLRRMKMIETREE